MSPPLEEEEDSLPPSAPLPGTAFRTPRPTPPGARRLASRRTRDHPGAAGSKNPFLSTLLATLRTLTAHSLRLFLALTPLQRTLLLLASAALFALGILALVYSHRIFAFLAPLAATWRSSALAWCLIWLVTFCTAFPPLIGYSTSLTVAGFVYGFPAGWPLAASATVAGSAAAFLSSRGVLKGYVHRLVGRDRRFVALGQVLQRDGLGVLVMVRLCPLPYSLSNGFLATVGSVGLRGFVLASAAATPKLLVHIFIGSRLALLAESGDKMSRLESAVNYGSMALFGLLGFGVGLFIYRRTMARAAELAREVGLEAGEALLDDVGGDEELEQGVLGRDDTENGRLVDPDDLDVAAIMDDDDDISLWDTAGDGAYRDSWHDEAAGGRVPNGHDHGSINGAGK